MDVTSRWNAKTDEEIEAAFTRLDQYTPETQATIRAEYEQRSLKASAPAEAQAALRRTSLRAAQAHLATMSSTGPTAAGDVHLSGGSPRPPLVHDDATRTRPEQNDVRSRYEYKVVPFIGQSRGSLSADNVASQIERVIAEHAAADWEFYQLSDVNIEVQPGCIAGLFGASAQYVRFDQLIFRRARRT